MDKDNGAGTGGRGLAVPVVHTGKGTLEQTFVVINLFSSELALAHGHIGLDGLGRDGRCLDNKVGGKGKCYGSNERLGKVHGWDVRVCKEKERDARKEEGRWEGQKEVQSDKEKK